MGHYQTIKECSNNKKIDNKGDGLDGFSREIKKYYKHQSSKKSRRKFKENIKKDLTNEAIYDIIDT